MTKLLGFCEEPLRVSCGVDGHDTQHRIFRIKLLDRIENGLLKIIKRSTAQIDRSHEGIVERRRWSWIKFPVRPRAEITLRSAEHFSKGRRGVLTRSE